ncbi:alpha/beta fold hydrolase [Micromonospora sp.]|uniref:alpha/beta fold hydrolase n=1 Tax=Micromonospora sp. TaxID=1876 RepID=UPI003B3BC7B6
MSRPTVPSERDVPLPDGGTLHVYDTGDDGTGRLPVVWHHGTPNIGAPPAPLFAAADRLGLRWVSYDRPGYGGSTRRPGRDVASAAGDVARVADALGLPRYATMGHSGGAPHALASGALHPDRVVAVVAVAGLAPYDAAGLDWFAGMTPSGQESLRAATRGRAVKERHAASDTDYDPEFTPADLATLAGPWAWLEEVVGPAVRGGPDGLVDDDLAYVTPWGFDPARVTVPVLLLHGGRDRVVPASHSRWLAGVCPAAELRITDDDGHLSVLGGAPAALEWLRR